MFKAMIDMGHGKTRLISANEYQREYGTLKKRGKLHCPICKRPVRPCAMSKGGIQAPHFRHTVNDAKAKNCELFASRAALDGYGTSSISTSFSSAEYKRVPLPMFIRRGRSKADQYIVEGGFKAPHIDILKQLSDSTAQLMVGKYKKYNIDSRRFGEGLARIPFEELSLSVSNYLRIGGCAIPFEKVWAPPEDAIQAMLFTCDVETFQGKRIRRGESIDSNASLLVLIPESGRHALKAAFPNAQELGFAGKRYGGANERLLVFGVRLGSSSGNNAKEEAYIEACGMEIGEPFFAPQLLWPPALLADGEIRTLFRSSSSVLEIDAEKAAGRSYSIVNGYDEHQTRDYYKVPGINSSQHLFVALKPPVGMQTLSMDTGTLDDNLLIEHAGSETTEHLTSRNLCPEVWESEDGAVVINAKCPCLAIHT